MCVIIVFVIAIYIYYISSNFIEIFFNCVYFYFDTHKILFQKRVICFAVNCRRCSPLSKDSLLSTMIEYRTVVRLTYKSANNKFYCRVVNVTLLLVFRSWYKSFHRLHFKYVNVGLFAPNVQRAEMARFCFRRSFVVKGSANYM